MAPAPAPASTCTKTGPRYTHIDTYPDCPYTNYNLYDNPTTVLNNVEIIDIWVVSITGIFSLIALVLMVVKVVCCRRQRKRKAWYGPMAAHYRNGGLPPWEADGGSAVRNNASSGVTYPPTNSDPKAQYESPTQFGNVPPSSKQTKARYNPPPVLYNEQPNMSGGLQNIYTELQNTDSEVPQCVYNVPRKRYTPPPTAPGQYSSPMSPPPVMQSPDSTVLAFPH